jgi:uncharacterized protein YndB with AHSA1/START domain
MTEMPADVIAPIRFSIETSASPELAWAYLTDPARVAEWFTEASEVGEVGDLYRLDFGDGSVVEGRIAALEPGRRFAHGWAWLNDEPRQPTLVTWTVGTRAGGGTIIELVHDGWSDAGADTAIRDDHEGYWSGYLDDLRDLLGDAERS